MITIRTHSLWKGQVGIRDKYLREANEKKEGFEIKHKEEMMTIPFEEVESRIVAKSERMFWDNYSTELHHLIYYKWKADKNPQLSLL